MALDENDYEEVLVRIVDALEDIVKIMSEWSSSDPEARPLWVRQDKS